MNAGRAPSWEVRETAKGRRHVIPINDIREHDPNDCPCGAEDDGFCIVHNSFDGREAFEPDYRGIKRKPS